MADNGDTGETGGETGGFVFGDEPTDDGSGATSGGLDIGNIAVALLLLVVVIILVYVGQLLVTGAVTDLLGENSGESAVPNGTATGTTAPSTVSEMQRTETVGDGAITDGATPITRRTSVSPPSSPTTQTPTATPARTASATATATPTATLTQTDGDGGTGTGGGDGGGDGDGTGTETATPVERSPVIEAFTVADRSGGGAAVFDVAWNVSDPNRDLVAVRVSLVADPDGEARIVERRRFDAGGAQTAGNTTFEVAGGAGEAYEVRIEVVDSSGNTAFSLTRAVADGTSDE